MSEGLQLQRTDLMSDALHLRIPMVRTALFSEKCPAPTALEAAKRTVYDVYCLRLVMTNGSVEQMHSFICCFGE